jgi:hypothetical protein
LELELKFSRASWALKQSTLNSLFSAVLTFLIIEQFNSIMEPLS